MPQTDSKELVKASTSKEVEGMLQDSKDIERVQAEYLSHLSETSGFQFTDYEKSVLFAPVEIEEVLIKPPNKLFLNWTWYANRMDKALGQGEWKVTPDPMYYKIVIQGKTVYGFYVCWIRRQLASHGVGAHQEERQTFNLGDAIKSAYSDGITQCCKNLGMGRDLWSPRVVSAILERKKAGPNTSPQPGGSPAGAPGERPTPALNTELLEKIRVFLIEMYPGQGVVEKKAKTDTLKKFFNATWSEMQLMSAEDLTRGFMGMVKAFSEGKQDE